MRRLLVCSSIVNDSRDSDTLGVLYGFQGKTEQSHAEKTRLWSLLILICYKTDKQDTPVDHGNLLENIIDLQ